MISIAPTGLPRKFAGGMGWEPDLEKVPQTDMLRLICLSGGRPIRTSLSGFIGTDLTLL
jgi:hypothetical protein